MTETTKKPTTRKRTNSTTKKVEPKKEVESTIEEVEATPAKPQRQKRKEIDRNELIACRSSVNGRLIYISPRSKEKFIWDDFGAVEYVEMGELMTMKSSHPKFLKDVQLIIDDEEAAEYLGMTKIYDEMAQLDDLDDLDDFFDKEPDEIAELLPKLPEGLKKAVGTRARALVEEGLLDRISKIRLIEQELGVDLQLFIPKH